MEQILAKLNTKNPIIEVPVHVESYSQPDSCFFNVLDKVENDGGDIVYGWKIHQSKILLEAERHAVWRSVEGDLVDITPSSKREASSLFVVEDNGWKYDGKFTDNIRINLTNNPLVDDYILLSETITKLYQTGERKSRMGVSILEPVYNLIQLFEMDKQYREAFINAGNSIQSTCYCASGQSYNECHGLNLTLLYQGLLAKVDSLVKNAK